MIMSSFFPNLTYDSTQQKMDCESIDTLEATFPSSLNSLFNDRR